MGNTLKLQTKAALLDPHFRSLKFIPEYDRKTGIADLESDFDLIFSNSDAVMNLSFHQRDQRKNLS